MAGEMEVAVFMGLAHMFREMVNNSNLEVEYAGRVCDPVWHLAPGYKNTYLFPELARPSCYVMLFLRPSLNPTPVPLDFQKHFVGLNQKLVSVFKTMKSLPRRNPELSRPR